MTFIKKEYLVRKTTARKGEGMPSTRNWWIPTFFGNGLTCRVLIGLVHFPPKYAGKKVRFKLEVIKE